MGKQPLPHLGRAWQQPQLPGVPWNNSLCCISAIYLGMAWACRIQKLPPQDATDLGIPRDSGILGMEGRKRTKDTDGCGCPRPLDSCARGGSGLDGGLGMVGQGEKEAKLLGGGVSLPTRNTAGRGPRGCSHHPCRDACGQTGEASWRR